VVDDRSTDGTDAVLAAVAAEQPRLRVVPIRELPAGWLGKSHALHTAAIDESAPWLLFTDADVHFAPGAPRRAVAWAVREGADHVTVVPEFLTGGVGERLFLMVIGLAFASRVLGGRIGRPGSSSHLGVGAFNLVRSDAFRAIGGFTHLALSVDDDVRLAQALKAAGFQGRALMGGGAVSVRWHAGVGGLTRGLEKNLFALLDYRLGAVIVVCLAWLAFGVAPYAGLFLGPSWTRVVCGLGVAAVAAILSLARRQTGTPWYYALAFPAGIALYVNAMTRSAWLTLRRRGVRWRECHYPLDALREHVRRRNAWLRAGCPADGPDPTPEAVTPHGSPAPETG
jgi:hypothetical protein